MPKIGKQMPKKPVSTSDNINQKHSLAGYRFHLLPAILSNNKSNLRKYEEGINRSIKT